MRQVNSVLVSCDICGFEEVIDVTEETPTIKLWVDDALVESGWDIRQNGRDICPDCGDDREDWEDVE